MEQTGKEGHGYHITMYPHIDLVHTPRPTLKLTRDLITLSIWDELDDVKESRGIAVVDLKLDHFI